MANILVIDDDQGTRLLIKKILKRKGHDILEAADGDLGLELFKKNDIDLVITDVIMKHSGLNVIKSIKEKNSNLPIIAITGSLIAASMLQNEYQISSMLVKPFNNQTLIDVVEKSLL
jgi:two-component system autoinducer 1 sensor kinase/phosphatase LuxN